MAYVLLTGPSERIQNLGASGPSFSNEEYIVMCWRVTRQVVLKHALAAHEKGVSLRAHLEDVAGFRSDGW